jgi:hypothetical protein
VMHTSHVHSIWVLQGESHTAVANLPATVSGKCFVQLAGLGARLPAHQSSLPLTQAHFHQQKGYWIVRTVASCALHHGGYMGRVYNRSSSLPPPSDTPPPFKLLGRTCALLPCQDYVVVSG